MGSFLRVASGLCLAWTVLLLFGLDWIAAPEQQTHLALGMAHGQAVAFLVFAFLFWRAAGERQPNTTVIVGAAIFLVLRVATDLYDLLLLVDGVQGLVSLFDLVLCVALSVGVIEMLPRTLRPQNEKRAEG